MKSHNHGIFNILLRNIAQLNCNYSDSNIVESVTESSDEVITDAFKYSKSSD